MSLAVGIDLGTTNCCVALYRNNQIQIIETLDGKRTTPSHVFYSDYGVLIGHEAINASILNPPNGIFDAKRIIGRKFHEVPSEMTQVWPFTVIRSDDGEARIEVTQNREKIAIRPEEVSAEILQKLRQDIHRSIGIPVTNAVITVPAYFSNPQRQATKDAARIAGFNVLKLINEPTAAALAFTRELSDANQRTVLVYDLGGGTFDVSLIKMNNRGGEVLAVAGDSHLGGRDFDQNLFQYILKQIPHIQNLKGIERRRAERRLKTYCESLKKKLSLTKSATVELDDFHGKDIELTITREDFNNINEELINRTISIVEKLLKDADISKNSVDEVVLVGGSTRIPKIEETVKAFFNDKTLNKTINPDEAVAIGAAIQAALVNIHPLQKIIGYTFSDVTPFPLGIKVKPPKSMSVIIKKNSKVPARAVKKYCTIEDYQRAIAISIYEGVNSEAEDNISLGQFCIENITPKPKGQVEVLVQLQVDSNGILTVTAQESSKNIIRDLKIVLNNGSLTEDQIKRLIAKKLSEEAKSYLNKKTINHNL